MRILLVDLAKRFGGVDVRVLQTAKFLGARHEVAVAVLEGAPVHRALEAAGLRVFVITKARHDPRIILDLRNIMRSYKPDVIDTHNPQSQLWGMLAARMVPQVVRLVTVHTVYREAHRGGFRQYGHEAILRLSRAMGAEFLTVSGSISTYLRDLGVLPARVHLSYNAMEPLPEVPKATGLRETLGLAKGDVLLAMIGRLEHVKAHDVMLGALARLAGQGRRFHLVVVGAGHEEETIRRLTSELQLSDTTHFLGFRRDIPEILSEIDIFCTPSRSEGLPYTGLEAARQGLPMIAASVDGLAEVFEQGVTAEMVPSEDEAALATAILRLADDPAYRDGLGQKARELVETQFAIPRMVAETISIYEAAVARQRAKLGQVSSTEQ